MAEKFMVPEEKIATTPPVWPFQARPVMSAPALLTVTLLYSGTATTCVVPFA